MLQEKLGWFYPKGYLGCMLDGKVHFGHLPGAYIYVGQPPLAAILVEVLKYCYERDLLGFGRGRVWLFV